ncbi:phospholipase D family protein [Kineococcus radiotolerans]|uniref:Phospholipase D/Transphosphatidylase n=1 Tax=Kineococcus radiotolerans (strain ATCC BAA-149 / DSM 14245 / SRS30216) TaxID=266940 RepID=A6WA40_KINRD|nr:phospholipase D family protein [Kineococcus radiotolerans]ABS03679.1 phospholipase D/Transphosphatidylase [Kineococcus radiotolerans SRS30216 = ATCC BAA-149]
MSHHQDATFSTAATTAASATAAASATTAATKGATATRDGAGDGAGDRSATVWLLSGAERGNGATRLPAWSRGNRVQPLVDGVAYFSALAAALAGSGEGDLVLFADWQGDPDELLTDDGPTIAEALTAAARRGAVVKGLVWRSPWDWQRLVPERNRHLAQKVKGGAEVLLDQRVRTLGSHHQKFLVIRHLHRPQDDVAFVGSLDLAHSRRDGTAHHGDRQRMSFGSKYGRHPSWHDIHTAVRGPAVDHVETVFRERWEDRAPLSLLPWQVGSDLLRRLVRRPVPLPPPQPMPAAAAHPAEEEPTSGEPAPGEPAPGEPTPGGPALGPAPDALTPGSCVVQLLRTYPRRWPRYPFAPQGEASIVAAHVKVLRRARRLVYVEEQFLWSRQVAGVFADALRATSGLQLVVLVPRHPKRGGLAAPALLLGQVRALEVLRAAGGDRVHVFDVENEQGEAVYVHSKVTIVDDVWACVRSDNLNRRSWSHDSELSVAVLDEAHDQREPADPAGLGDGARRFARDLRLQLMREHLGRSGFESEQGEQDERGSGWEGDRRGDRGDDWGDLDLLDPHRAVAALRASAAALDAWHAGGRRGSRPAGRLRFHRDPVLPRWQQVLAAPVQRIVLDPAGSTGGRAGR